MIDFKFSKLQKEELLYKMGIAQEIIEDDGETYYDNDDGEQFTYEEIEEVKKMIETNNGGIEEQFRSIFIEEFRIMEDVANGNLPEGVKKAELVSWQEGDWKTRREARNALEKLEEGK